MRIEKHQITNPLRLFAIAKLNTGFYWSVLMDANSNSWLILPDIRSGWDFGQIYADGEKRETFHRPKALLTF